MSDVPYEKVGEYEGIPIYSLDESRAGPEDLHAEQLLKEQCILGAIDDGELSIKSINPETLEVKFDFHS